MGGKSKDSGITLVALVVTIVVLLILAGITLTYVFGDNGIIKLAQEARNKTEQGMQNEQDDLENLVNWLKEENGNDGESIPKIGPDKKGEIQTADKTVYQDETGTAIIPGGFCVVKDSPTNAKDKNTVESGLVISDKANDDLDNTDGETKGNQFVWIPVSDYSKFHLIEGYQSNRLQDYLSRETYPSREAGDTTQASSLGESIAANSVAGTAESIAMYKSVKDNGGFYIARFEAGIAGTTSSSKINGTIQPVLDGSVKPVSQKGVGVWNYIPWGGTKEDVASDNLPGNDNANGAVKVARSMYPATDTVHKVISTLCYGVQWDAALKFIEPNYGEYNEEKTDYIVAEDSYVRDGTDRGDYTYDITTAGSNINYQQKHIYDMAGGLYEWTMEAGGNEWFSNCRVIRGLYYYYGGNNGPSSCRCLARPEENVQDDCSGDNNDKGIGARVALYVL